MNGVDSIYYNEYWSKLKQQGKNNVYTESQQEVESQQEAERKVAFDNFNQKQQAIYEKYGSDASSLLIGDFFRTCFTNGCVLDYDKIFEQYETDVSRRNFNFVWSQEYKEYKKALKDLNFYTRRKFYLDYAQKPAEEIEAMKSKDLLYYEALISEVEKYYAIEGHLRKDATTTTFYNIAHREDSVIFDNHYIPFDREFDCAYSTYMGASTKDGDTSEKIYNEMMKYLNETRDRLKTMTADEFREYKIEKLNLSKDELSRIRDSVVEMSKTEENNLTEEQKFNVSQDERQSIATDLEQHIESKLDEDTKKDLNQNDVEIPVEEFEFIEESQEQLQSKRFFEDVLVEKMNNQNVSYPREFQSAVLKFLDNMSPFNISETQVSTGRKEKEDVVAGALGSLNGTLWVEENTEQKLTELEYTLSKMSSDIYDLKLNMGKDMTLDFRYDNRVPENGAKISIGRYRNVDSNPKLGINGIEYEGNILGDGRIVAKGVATKVPSSYDENGNLRDVSKEVIGEFTVNSYEALNSLTNEALGLNESKNVTL